MASIDDFELEDPVFSFSLDGLFASPEIDPSLIATATDLFLASSNESSLLPSTTDTSISGISIGDNQVQVQWSTWKSYPNAPIGDWGWVIPTSPSARLSFQRIARAIHNDKQLYPYSRQFVHFELACSTDDNAVPDATPISVDEKDPRYFRGFWRCNMLGPRPLGNIGLGWLLGSNTNQCELLLDTDIDTNGVEQRHLRIRRLESGTVLITASWYPIKVGTLELQQFKNKPDQHVDRYQRTAEACTSIVIGNLIYELQIQDIPPEQDAMDLAFAYDRDSKQDRLPQIVWTPTPSFMKGSTEMGKYRMARAFAGGTFGSAHYAWDQATGSKVCIKKVRRTHWTTSNVDLEIDLLRSLNHVSIKESSRQNIGMLTWLQPNICKLVEVIEDPYAPVGCMTPKATDVHLVLLPAARSTLEFFTQPELPAELTWSTTEVERAQTALPIATQLCSAFAYMHEQGIMHRDFKPANTLLIKLNPLIVSVIDFGAGIRAKTDEDWNKGTAAYLAPEITALKNWAKKPEKGRPKKPSAYDSKIDVFAPGLTIVEVYFRTEIWRRPQFVYAAHSRQLQTCKERLEKGLEDPSKLMLIVRRMLKPNPKDRISAKDAHAMFLSLCPADTGKRYPEDQAAQGSSKKPHRNNTV